MTEYIIGCIGTWMLADAVSSLWTYTGNSERAKGQTFWRDHALRIFRGLLGIGLIIIGIILICSVEIGIGSYI